MAFDAAGDFTKAIGTFNDTTSSLPSITTGNYLNCFDGSKVRRHDFYQIAYDTFVSIIQSAATHQLNDDKIVVNLMWIAPEGFEGNVTFR